MAKRRKPRNWHEDSSAISGKAISDCQRTRSHRNNERILIFGGRRGEGRQGSTVILKSKPIYERSTKHQSKTGESFVNEEKQEISAWENIGGGKKQSTDTR